MTIVSFSAAKVSDLATTTPVFYVAITLAAWDGFLSALRMFADSDAWYRRSRIISFVLDLLLAAVYWLWYSAIQEANGAALTTCVIPEVICGVASVLLAASVLVRSFRTCFKRYLL